MFLTTKQIVIVMELSDIYSDKIIQIAGRLSAIERLGAPDASARKVSRVCGSVVEVDLDLKDGVVTDYAHDISACALGQTSASVVAEHIVGATADELRLLRTHMIAMLKGGGEPPVGRWADLAYLQPVVGYPARHASILLVFEAVVDCLDQIEKLSTN